MQPATDGMFRRIQVFVAVYVALLLAGAAGLDRRNVAASGDSVAEPVNFGPEVVCDGPDQSAVGSSADADENLIEAFAVSKNPNEPLYIPVTIQGEIWWFIVDSGASYTVVDLQVARHLGMIDGHRTSRNRWCYPLPPASIGKSQIPVTVNAFCFDLSHLGRICGILGTDFLMAHVVAIDLDAGKLSFLRAAPESAGHEFRLARDSVGRPTLDVEVAENKSVRFLLDTGCAGPNAGSIQARTFANLADQDQLRLIGKTLRAGFTGTMQCRRAVLDRFQVGSFEHRQLEFLEHSDANLLGLGYLSRYVAVIDFPRDRLYLREGRRFSQQPGDLEVERRAEAATLPSAAAGAMSNAFGWNSGRDWVAR